MLFAGRAPDHIARPNFLFRASLALHPPTSGGDDQGLPERMGVPCGSSTWLKRNTPPTRARRVGRLEQRIDAHRAGEIFFRSFARRLCSVSLDFHLNPPVECDPTLVLLGCRRGSCSTCGDIARNQREPRSTTRKMPLSRCRNVRDCCRNDWFSLNQSELRSTLAAIFARGHASFSAKEFGEMTRIGVANIERDVHHILLRFAKQLSRDVDPQINLIAGR